MTSLNSRDFQDSNSSGLITWSGDCIPCLGIKTGDNLNVVTAIIAAKVCELASPLDLSTLTLQGALDIFDRDEPGTRTIVNVLQLALDNEVGLKELIDNLQTQVDGIGTDNLVLDLKCLKETDSFGNSLPYNQQSVLQDLLDNICSQQASITDLSGKYTTLKNTVDNLDIPSGDEVEITTCISGPKVVSQAVIDIANDYCEYKDDVGSSAQIQTAIARQTARFNTLMSGVAGWVVPSDPTNFSLAQSVNNLWLLMTNRDALLIALEDCCGTTCDDIKVGFIANMEDNTVILSFTLGAGTSIPSGFTDCGSVLTITDELGISTSVSIVVLQGGETDAIDLSMFTQGSILDFNIDLKMCSDTMSCQKCINKNVKYLNSGCCVLSNNSSSSITISYITTANS